MSDKVHSQILRMLSKKRQLAAEKNAAFRIRSITKENQTHTKEDNYGIFYRALLAAQPKKNFFVLFLKIKKEDGKFTYAAIDQRVVACEIGCTIQQNF